MPSLFAQKKQTLSAPQNRIQSGPMSRPRLIALRIDRDNFNILATNPPVKN
jgi:hypothetical protein